MPATDLCYRTATELALLIQSREASCREVMEAHLAQIAAVNPRVNAIIGKLDDHACLKLADEADAELARGQVRGPLHGLPIAHKDLVPARGLPWTQGSPIFAQRVADMDALLVERLKAAGCLTIGKTNTPEFGAGSQTFNPVWGTTYNPYDMTRTAGGSSGGAAAALACRMLPLADGSDTGGSLRNPGNFNNVIGFRTSPGRVPVWPSPLGWYPISVQGPMARTVTDTALMLSVMAGPDDRSPISIREPGSRFAEPLTRDFNGVKVAWSADLGGLPVDARVTKVLEAARPVFEALGCTVAEGAPDFAGAEESFLAWRAWRMEVMHGERLNTHREQMKDTVVWNTEQGQKLTGPELGRAEVLRTQLYHRVREFMADHEFLLCPVNQVPPFDASQPYITEINGQKMGNYIEWMRSAYYITVTGLPAISVPAGFTDDGLPVGLQIVGRHQDDFGVLQLAHAFEQATRHHERLPGVLNPEAAA